MELYLLPNVLICVLSKNRATPKMGRIASAWFMPLFVLCVTLACTGEYLSNAFCTVGQEMFVMLLAVSNGLVTSL